MTYRAGYASGKPDHGSTRAFCRAGPGWRGWRRPESGAGPASACGGF